MGIGRSGLLWKVTLLGTLMALLGWLHAFALASSAKHSEAFVLAPYLAQAGEAVPGAPDTLVVASSLQEASSAQAMFVCTGLEFTLADPDNPVYYDTAISGLFALKQGADGLFYVDLDDPGTPSIEIIDTGCTTGVNSEVYASLYTPNTWFWRLSFQGTPVMADDTLNEHMTGGYIDEHWRLDGLTPEMAQGATVYIFSEIVPYRFEVQYHDPQGSPIAHGHLYALAGSNLANPPRIALPVPPNVDVTYRAMEAINGSLTDVSEPIRVQLEYEGLPSYPVTFYDGDVQHGQVQWISQGDAIDWAQVSVPDGTEGRRFLGWALAGAQGLFDLDTPITQAVTLYAQYGATHRVQFFAQVGDAQPHASVSVPAGETVPMDQVDRPGINQRFLGWYTQTGAAFTEETPVTADLSVFGRYAPLEATVGFSAGYTCHAAPDDPINGRANQRLTYDSTSLLYDAALDAYYFHAAALPAEGYRDGTANVYAFTQGTDDWHWQDTPGGTPYAFSVRGDRWYFDGLSAAAYEDTPALDVRYGQEIVTYMLYFSDADGKIVYAGHPVLAGFGLPWLLDNQMALDRLPADTLEAFDRWVVADGREVGDLSAVEGCVVLQAQYKPWHTVLFYLDASMQSLHCAQEVLDMRQIQWQAVRDPAKANAVFDGWLRYDPVTKACVALDDPNAPISEPIALVAKFTALHTVTFVDVQGKALAAHSVRNGERLTQTMPTAPSRDGLRFTRWETAQGHAYDPKTPVTGDVLVRPAYEADVVFMDNGAVHETITVREGTILTMLPDDPWGGAGYTFHHWDTNPLGKRITRDTVITALFSVEIRYIYGLEGELLRTVFVPQGSALVPPDMEIWGYDCDWGLPLTPVATVPMTFYASYTEKPESELPQEGEWDDGTAGEWEDTFYDMPEETQMDEWMLVEMELQAGGDWATGSTGMQMLGDENPATDWLWPEVRMPGVPAYEMILQGGRFALHPDDVPPSGGANGAPSRVECME